MRTSKIVIWDLETLPNLPQAMRNWVKLSGWPGTTLRADLSTVICFGYMILGEDEPKVICAWDFPGWETNVNDDSQVVKAAYHILKDADAQVTHNGKRFDEKFLQTRLLLNGHSNLPKIPHLDCCAEAKRHLFLHANSLKNLSRVLGSQQKIENEGWDLWVRVWEKERAAMDEMAAYCAGDVLSTRDNFKVLRRFMTALPNQNLFTDGPQKICPNCGSTRLKACGHRMTKTMTYRRYRCVDCQAYSRTDVADRFPRSI